jgi:hypothetical protein
VFAVAEFAAAVFVDDPAQIDHCPVAGTDVLDFG